MKPVTAVVIGFLTFCLASCKEAPTWKSRLYTERTLASTVGEVRVPAELWQRVIAPDRPLKSILDVSQVPTPNQGGGDSAIARATVETDLKPITLYLIEETHGVLGGRNQKLVFGPGGGDIDLRDFILEKKGVFRLVFDFAPDPEGAPDPTLVRRVWYLSDAKRRKVGPDAVGAGCDTYMDISSFVTKSNEKDGILFAVNSDRHVSALAGTFLFSVKRGSRIEVSRLTFFDSTKKKDLQCLGRSES